MLLWLLCVVRSTSSATYGSSVRCSHLRVVVCSAYVLVKHKQHFLRARVSPDRVSSNHPPADSRVGRLEILVSSPTHLPCLFYDSTQFHPKESAPLYGQQKTGGRLRYSSFSQNNVVPHRGIYGVSPKRLLPPTAPIYPERECYLYHTAST